MELFYNKNFTISLSIARSDLWMNLLGHSLQGTMWRCISAHLNPSDLHTAKPSAFTDSLAFLSFLIPMEAVSVYFLFHVTLL